MKLILHPAINGAWLARELGVHRGTVSKWTTGEREVSTERIHQLAWTLGKMCREVMETEFLEIEDE